MLIIFGLGILVGIALVIRLIKIGGVIIIGLEKLKTILESKNTKG